ncbi:MAG TPA: hypothetical protein VIW26_07960 [Gemmatimonadales bacterium]|jgi:hypothetical protein
MERVLRDERGMALAVAIFALVVAGALIAGAFYAGNQEQRVGQNTLRVQQSFGAGEEALNEIVANWQPGTYNKLGIYPADSFIVPSTNTAGGTGQYGGVIRKLNNYLYQVDLTGRDNRSASGAVFGGGARQRIGEFVRIRLLDIGIGGALTTQGSVKLSGNAYVDGTDHIPLGWSSSSCDTTGDTTKAGVRAPDSAVVQTGSGAHLAGNPPFLKDTSVHASTFTQFGDISYDDLAAMATIQLPGGTDKTDPNISSGVCVQTDPMNWGDGMNPSSACGNYFPIVHIAGDATLNGDQGQGILLVDGDLSIQGAYQYFGIVLVKGSLKTAGTGGDIAHFWGAVMAENVDIETNNLSGSATLNYSKCAITQALNMTGVVAPDRSRSWSLLF